MSEIDDLIQILESNFTLDKIPQNPCAFITKDLQIFPISLDTKLLSKLMEITSETYLIKKLLPQLPNWRLYFPTAQNVYPDMLFHNINTGEYVAIDFKSTYLGEVSKTKLAQRTSLSNQDGNVDEDEANGFTLGTYNGYFKNTESRPCCKAMVNEKITKFYYGKFSAHFLIIYIYKRKLEPEQKSEKILSYEQLKAVISQIPNQIEITNVVVIPKWKIATKIQGSGNTANIGGNINNLSDLSKFKPDFESCEQFEEFWRFKFDHNDGLRRIKRKYPDFEIPYHDFNEYIEWVNKGRPNLDFYKKVLLVF